MRVVWKFRNAVQAELDSSEILIWALGDFGHRQAEIDAETLTLAIGACMTGQNSWAPKRATTLSPPSLPCTWLAMAETGVTL